MHLDKNEAENGMPQFGNTEIRAYLVPISRMSQDDEEFMSDAEQLGSVYSLKGFQFALNHDMVKTNDYFIRFLEVPRTLNQKMINMDEQ